MKKRIASAALVGVMLVLWIDCRTVPAATDTETAGDVLQYVLPAVTAGLLAGQRDGAGALQFGESFGLTLGVTQVLKITVDETRPNGGHYSFPSGHTSASFSCAEFLRRRYGWRIGLPAYLAATFVGYSRVESHQHYTHDVVAGAAIGVISSFVFTTPYKGWQVGLNADHDFLGMTLSRAW
ncbi:MAG: phosphatase PAP2 family protein [Candidatus Methylomirabilia bacterium]